MNNALTRGLGGLLIVLLSMGATAATASAQETDKHPGLDIIEILSEDSPTTNPQAESAAPFTYTELPQVGSQFSYYNAPSTSFTTKTARAIKNSRTETSAYIMAFAEEFNRCMAYTGHTSKKEQNRCAERARAAGEGADAATTDTTEIITPGDTHEEGMLPDNINPDT